ncbi:MAG: LON peptidase substrate-binding domain-containing protein [Opitutales bacterium]
MAVTIEIPSEVPVMTLPNTTLFPHAVLPLYIFEPRYRTMLQHVLESDRLFAVAGMNVKEAEATGRFEPPYEVATVGMVRHCRKNADETSHLVLQGLARIRFKRIISEEPYRLTEIEPLDTEPGAEDKDLRELRANLTRLISQNRKLGGNIPQELVEFLTQVRDPEVFLDIAAFTLCPDHQQKQMLLEQLNVARRYERYLELLRRENERLIIDKKLKGGLDDDGIQMN